MYEAVADPYCYPGTQILKNIPDLRSQAALDKFEAAATGRRFIEPMPVGRWSMSHFAAIHRHIFQDVYAWAGRFRTEQISKGSSMFCYPENIAGELRRAFDEMRQAAFLRNLDAAAFSVAAAHFAAELNAIHAFRDGNGRTLLAFMTILAVQAGHPFDLDRLDPDAFLAAMIASFHGREKALAAQFRLLVE